MVKVACHASKAEEDCKAKNGFQKVFHFFYCLDLRHIIYKCIFARALTFYGAKIRYNVFIPNKYTKKCVFVMVK